MATIQKVITHARRLSRYLVVKENEGEAHKKPKKKNLRGVAEDAHHLKNLRRAASYNTPRALLINDCWRSWDGVAAHKVCKK